VQLKEKLQSPKPTLSVKQQPVISLYGLFGFSEEEHKQINIIRRDRKKSTPKQGKSVQLNLFL
jgi:hypothetical protein